MTRAGAFDVVALPTGSFTFPEGEEYAGQTGLVVAYAIRHPGGVFLFDTGFAPAGPDLDPFYPRWDVRPRSLPEVLSNAGIDIAEITAVANCHLHLDHSGQNDLFPGIPIYVQGAEWDAAHEPDYTYLPSIDFPGRHTSSGPVTTRSRRGSASSRRPVIRPATSRWSSRHPTARSSSQGRRCTATGSGPVSRARAKGRRRRGTATPTPARSPGSRP